MASRRLAPALLLVALAAPTAAGTPAPLALIVKDGDTPSGLLVEHFREIRSVVPALARGTARDLAYRLLARSPQVAARVLHPGDRLVVLPGGRLRLDTAPVREPEPSPEPPPPPELPEPPAPVVAPPPAPVAALAPAPAAPAARVAADGRRLSLPDGPELAAGPGLTLFERAGMLHVVRLASPPFDVAFPLGEGAFAVPPNPFVRLSRDGRRLVPADHEDDPGPYVARGELNIHEDHLHLTSKFPRESWRALYAARNDPGLDALRQKAAAALIVKLLEIHIARDPEKFGESLAATAETVDRTWRAFDRGVEAREIAEQMDLGYEVSSDGRTVQVGDRVYVTAPPLRFESCTGHFHVLGTSDDHRFASKVPVGEGVFSFPPNPFYEVVGNVVVPSAPMPLWMSMVRTGALEQRRGHYHLTARWNQPSVASLDELMRTARSRQVRDEATGGLFRVLSVPMDPPDEEALRGDLARLGVLADQEYAALLEKAKKNGWSLDR